MRKKTTKVPKYVEKELESIISFKNVKLSTKQSELVSMITSNKITIATGPAGTSKTFSTCYAAAKLLESGFCDRIVITKPTEIVGNSDLGFLPGNLKEKLAVYEESFISNFSEIVEGKPLENLILTKKIEFKPVQFMRGSTFNRTVVIIDEFQSFDIKELMAIVTRLGNRNCKMVFIGDANQNDIAKKYVAINIFKEIIGGIRDTGIFEFKRNDIVRDPILIEITDRYDRMCEDGKLPDTKKKT